MEEADNLNWLIGRLALLLNAWKTILLGTIVLTAVGFVIFLASQTTLYSSQMVLPIAPATRMMMQAGAIRAGRFR